MSSDHSVALELLKNGTAVNFRVIDTQIHEGPDGGEFTVQIGLEFPIDPETDEHDLGWGAFGFLFVIATMSFAAARPRASSAVEYDERDEFQVGDLIQNLRWEQGALQFDADYVRGRRMKTRLVLRPSGSGQLTTLGRGKAAVRWLERLQGREPLKLVQS